MFKSHISYMEPTLPNSLRDKRASFVLKWKPVAALQTSLIMQLLMSYVQGQNHVPHRHENKTRSFVDIWFDQEGDTRSNGILALYIACQQLACFIPPLSYKLCFQIVFLEENIHWPSILHSLIQFILKLDLVTVKI